MLTKAGIERGLANFYGTEAYHSLGPLFPGLKMTDGPAWLAENADCVWLMVAIASHQPECRKDGMLRDFQLWTLKVAPDKSAVLKCERDTNDPKPIIQKLDWTDFPLDEIKLYVENGVLFLPSER